MAQDKTPNTGEPASTHTNPGSGQHRHYGPNGQPEWDIDYDHDNDHGQGVPHGHNWDKGKRGQGVPLSPLPQKTGPKLFPIQWTSKTMLIDEKSSRAALVLEPMFEDECISLHHRMPVWIIDSPQNRAAVEKIRQSDLPGESDVTTFPTREDESLAMACERILQSLDDHYNDHSQTPGYTELKVIGVSLGDVTLRPFLALNFNEFVRTANGFIAKKASNIALG